jgi:hypothetical protein
MRYGLIKLRTSSIHRISELQALVDSLDSTYASISTLDVAIDMMLGQRDDFDPKLVYGSSRWPDYDPRTLTDATEFVAEHRKQVRRYIDGSRSASNNRNEDYSILREEGRLMVHSFRMNSPGFWEFIGSLNPLEVIRSALNDRHTRRQDRAYREAAEAERLAMQNERARLENLELADRIAYRRIEALAAAGVSKKEVRYLTRRLVEKNLDHLESISDILDIDASQPVEEIRSPDPRFPR